MKRLLPFALLLMAGCASLDRHAAKEVHLIDNHGHVHHARTVGHAKAVHRVIVVDGQRVVKHYHVKRTWTSRVVNPHDYYGW